MIQRVLSVMPNRRSMGVAVLEGSERLVEWRLARFRETTVTAKAMVFRQLVGWFQPSLVVFEDIERSRRGKHVRQVIDRMSSISEEAGIPIETVSADEVCEHFRAVATDKYELVQALANFFPELAPRVPSRRLPGDGEDPRMSVFLAVAHALVVLRAHEQTTHLEKPHDEAYVQEETSPGSS